MYTENGRERLTFTKLVIDALRYLMAISKTTASFDNVSCLNKAPQVARVDDFKNYREEGNKNKRDQKQRRHLHFDYCPGGNNAGKNGLT